MSHGAHKFLVEPSRLKPFNADDKEVVRVIIETPKGSRNKYAFDEKERIFVLKKALPAGMAFPYDFGFVPSTLAEDGDPVDVLILMDEPAFCGCAVNCRLIGIIQGEQEDGKKSQRNDRVVAVEKGNHDWADIRHIDDMGKKFVTEIEQFFVNFHKLKGRKYRILGVKGPKQAMDAIKQGIKAAKK